MIKLAMITECWTPQSDTFFSVHVYLVSIELITTVTFLQYILVI